MAQRTQETVVITGASAGLGRAIALEFARHGAQLGLIARDEDRLNTLKDEIEAAGGKALIFSLDVTESDALDHAAGEVENTLGPIDVWVNAHMTTVFSAFHDMSADEFKRVTEVTYLGNVYGTMAALKRMRPRNRGSIVQVGSALAYRAIPMQTAYCAAKHAIKGYTEGLRCELIAEKSRIHLTMVEMPGLNTPQFDWCKSHLPRRARPVAPVYQPEVGARAVYWAAHNRRRDLWVGASSVMTILGSRIAPGLMDRYLARNAIGGQQSNQAEDPTRPDNLWATVPGERGTRGRFSNEARPHSAQLWAATHRKEIGLVAGAGVILGLLIGGECTRQSRRRRLRRFL
ncbi:SDR family oxidoreductase [Larsenimonas salina]|uniref:SDR family oxidoreductase n=1 Tax=Larsenimonas salina TaxID=1295565 RepID=UPI002073F7B3|nr:SDR family oxidoreductase [Larsenimonas salina]MCM5704521.1 SDR family oxidoreductase [Larsenimonas salina]